MTNLIEKSLILGFGIFTITVFSTLLIPFMDLIFEYNHNEKNSLESYVTFIDEVDQGIIYSSQNPKEFYVKEVYYPKDLNISFYNHFTKYEFLLENKICVKFIEYDITFINREFNNIPPQIYILNISQCSTFIEVNIINIL